MKKVLLCFGLGLVLLACNDKEDKDKEDDDDKKEKMTNATPADLPYTASYSSNFSTDVSDADLKMVLMSYKYWADGDMTGLAGTMADSVSAEMSDGGHFEGVNADLMKRWSSYRDSLSSVRIDMEAWQKMYSTDKKDSYVVTWYKEYDTYKSGKVDSAYFHDINQVKNGKISWYSQYKRPAKKM
ncbi:MAG TPA: hypothetical protein PKC72_10780 [Chitinophagaceae bacterium]|nr:hypothetical protein [Chitinophagaceae bacterium]